MTRHVCLPMEFATISILRCSCTYVARVGSRGTGVGTHSPLELFFLYFCLRRTQISRYGPATEGKTKGKLTGWNRVKRRLDFPGAISPVRARMMDEHELLRVLRVLHVLWSPLKPREGESAPPPFLPPSLRSEAQGSELSRPKCC